MTDKKNYVSLAKHVHLSERVFFANITDGIAKNLFMKSKFEIRATRQLPDVIHIFNKDPADKENRKVEQENGAGSQCKIQMKTFRCLHILGK